MDVVKNFFDMPNPLRFLVLSGAMALLFGIMPFFSSAPLVVFNDQVPIAAWLDSGLGRLGLVVGLVMFAATLLILKRFPRGRLLYLMGWLGLSSMPLIAACQLGIGLPKALPSLAVTLILTAVVATYLYGTSAVRRYFDPRLSNTAEGEAGAGGADQGDDRG